MLVKVFLFAVFVAVASAQKFFVCLNVVCEKYKSGDLTDDSKAVQALKELGYNLDDCALGTATLDPSFPTCAGPTAPFDVTITCAKKDADGKYLPPKCFDGIMGLYNPNFDCVTVVSKLQDIIVDSLKKCDEGGRRRRRSPLDPGLTFNFR